MNKIYKKIILCFIFITTAQSNWIMPSYDFKLNHHDNNALFITSGIATGVALAIYTGVHLYHWSKANKNAQDHKENDTKTQKIQNRGNLKDTILLIIEGAVLAIYTNAGVYRWATADQDHTVEQEIDLKIGYMLTPQIKSKIDLKNNNEKNILDVLETINPHAKFPGQDVEQVLNTDKSHINQVKTIDLWFRSWFNRNLNKKRQEIIEKESYLKEVHQFTHQHNRFLYGHHLNDKTNQLIIDPVTPENIRSIKMIQQIHNSQKIFWYSQLLKKKAQELTNYKSDQYPFLSKILNDKAVSLENLNDATTILRQYQTEKEEAWRQEDLRLAELRRQEDLRLEREKIKI